MNSPKTGLKLTETQSADHYPVTDGYYALYDYHVESQTHYIFCSLSSVHILFLFFLIPFSGHLSTEQINFVLTALVHALVYLRIENSSVRGHNFLRNGLISWEHCSRVPRFSATLTGAEDI